MVTHIVHPFEKAGLGLSPFRLEEVTEKCYTGIAYD